MSASLEDSLEDSLNSLDAFSALFTALHQNPVAGQQLISQLGQLDLSSSDQDKSLLGHIGLMKKLEQIGYVEDGQIQRRIMEDGKGYIELKAAVSAGKLPQVKKLIKAQGGLSKLMDKGVQSLVNASHCGQLEIVKYLVHEKVKINGKDAYGHTALWTAVEQSHYLIVQFLVAQGADVNTLDNQKSSVLMVAASRGSLPIIKMLCKAKANINYSFNGNSAISLAAYLGHTKVVEYLASNGALLEFPDGRNTSFTKSSALQYAVWNQHEEVVKLLLDLKSPLEPVLHDDNLTPLSRAASKSNTNILRLLLEAQANVEAIDHEGRSALFHAAWNAHHENVELLLSQPKTKVNQQDKNGETALMRASTQNQEKMVTMLLNAKADPNIRLFEEEGTALHLAATFGGFQVLERLVNAKADIHAKAKDGLTPIRFAAETGSLEKIKKLHQLGADVEVTDAKGFTPLMVAAEYGFSDIAKYLVENKANPETQEPVTGKNALHIAVQNQQEEVITTLIDHKANIESQARVHNNWTPLFEATLRGPKVVKRLLDAKANLGVETDLGETPLHFALATPTINIDTIKILIDRGVDLFAVAKDGAYPLLLAISQKNTEAIELLLNAMALKAREDDNSKISFIYTVKLSLNDVLRFGLGKIFDFLLKQECIKEIVQDWLKSALISCLQRGDDIGLKLLIERKMADVHYSNFTRKDLEFSFEIYTRELFSPRLSFLPDSFSPLTFAVLMGDLEVVKVLVNNGAQIEQCFIYDKTDDYSTNAVMLACDRGETEITAFLLYRSLFQRLKPFLKDKMNDMKLMQTIVQSFCDIVSMKQLEIDLKMNLAIQLDSFNEPQKIPKAFLVETEVCLPLDYVIEIIKHIFNKCSAENIIITENEFWEPHLIAEQQHKTAQEKEADKLLEQLKILLNPSILITSTIQESLDNVLKRLTVLDLEINCLIAESDTFFAMPNYIQFLATKGKEEENNQREKLKGFKQALDQFSKNIADIQKEFPELKEQYDEHLMENSATIREQIKNGQLLSAKKLLDELREDSSRKADLQKAEGYWKKLQEIEAKMQAIHKILQEQIAEKTKIVQAKPSKKGKSRQKAEDLQKIRDMMKEAKEKAKLAVLEKEKTIQEALQAHKLAFQAKQEEQKRNKEALRSKSTESSALERKHKLDQERPEWTDEQTTRQSYRAKDNFYHQRKPQALTVNSKSALTQFAILEDLVLGLNTMVSQGLMNELNQFNFDYYISKRNAFLGIIGQIMEVVMHFKTDYSPINPKEATHFRDCIYHHYDLIPKLTNSVAQHKDFYENLIRMARIILAYIQAIKNNTGRQKELYEQLKNDPFYQSIQRHPLGSEPTLDQCLTRWKTLSHEFEMIKGYQYPIEVLQLIQMHATGYIKGAKGVVAKDIKRLYPQEYVAHKQMYDAAIQDGKIYRHVKLTPESAFRLYTKVHVPFAELATIAKKATQILPKLERGLELKLS